jgi:hypothetical protein
LVHREGKLQTRQQERGPHHVFVSFSDPVSVND